MQRELGSKLNSKMHWLCTLGKPLDTQGLGVFVKESEVTILDLQNHYAD